MFEDGPRKEGPEKKQPKTGEGKSFQHHQGEVRNVATQLTFGHRSEGSPSQAGEVLFITRGDVSFIGCIVDDISNEESKHHEEDEHEKKQSNVWNDHIHDLAESDGHHKKTDQ